MGLSPKRRAFADYYIISRGNGAEAARRAGYSAKTARQQASKLLKEKAIAAYIAENLAALWEENAIEKDSVLEEIRRNAFARITDVVTWDDSGALTIVASDDLPVEALSAIREVKEIVTTSRTKDGRTITTRRFGFKMHDKAPMLTMLGRHLKLFDRAGEEPEKIPFSAIRALQAIASNGGD